MWIPTTHFCKACARWETATIVTAFYNRRQPQVTPWLSWSEVGFIYFAGGLLSALFTLLSQNLSIVSGIGLIGILALPYTIYSVYYQKFVARQWCKFCMAVQGVIWLEAILSLSNFSKFQYLWNMQSVLLVALAFLIPILLWIVVKDPISQGIAGFWFAAGIAKGEVQRALHSNNISKPAPDAAHF